MKLKPLFSLVYPAAMSIPLAGFGFFEGYLRLVVGMKSWLGQFTHKVVRKRGNCQLVIEIDHIANGQLPIGFFRWWLRALAANARKVTAKPPRNAKFAKTTTVNLGNHSLQKRER